MLYSLGKACVDGKQYAVAVDYLEAARRMSPHPQHYILNRLAQAYAGQGQIEKALRLYEQMPPNMRSPVGLHRATSRGALPAQRAMGQGRESPPRRSSDGKSANHNGFYFLGQALEHQERWGEAARSYETAIKPRRETYKRSFRRLRLLFLIIRRDHADSLNKPLEPRKVTSPGTANTDGRMTGRVKSFNSKGFGFLATDNGDLFFHISQVAERDEVQVGEKLEYEVGVGRDGRPAVKLRVVS